MTALRILEHGQERRLGPADFPVALGGPGSPVSLAAAAFPVAWLGLSDGEVFVPPVAGAGLLCNGSRLTASHWLRDGDVLRLGATRVEVRLRGADVVLALEELAEANPTEPPVVLVPPPRGAGRDDAGHQDATITPVAYEPHPLTGGAPEAKRRSPGSLLGLAFLLVLAGMALLVVSRLALVALRVDPVPDRVELRGSWPTLRLRSRSRGTTRWWRKRKATGGSRRPSKWSGKPSRSRLAGARPPCRGDAGVAGADGRSTAPGGLTPPAAFEVEAGERELTVTATGYEPQHAKLTIEGRGVRQSRACRSCRCPRRHGSAAAPAGLPALTSDPPGRAPDGATAARRRWSVARAGPASHRDGAASSSAGATRTRAGERREQALAEPQLGEADRRAAARRRSDRRRPAARARTRRSRSSRFRTRSRSAARDS